MILTRVHALKPNRLTLINGSVEQGPTEISPRIKLSADWPSHATLNCRACRVGRESSMFDQCVSFQENFLNQLPFFT